MKLRLFVTSSLIWAAVGLAMLITPTGACVAQSPARTPLVVTPRFAFNSDFDTNLNDALIAAGVAHKAGRPELFRSGAEESCFRQLPQPHRAAWDRAVDYYAEVVSPVEWTGRQQVLLRLDLARLNEGPRDSGARQFLEAARSLLAAAMPAYRACRWPVQDEKNRNCIAELKTRLAADEDKIGPRLTELYQKGWSGLPIQVDVVETGGWSGANTFILDSGGHVLISTSYQSAAALEAVFHEASHLLMNRGDPLRKALDQAASTADLRLPNDFWHVVLFYTTGEVVRAVLDDRGMPAYTPLVYEIFARSTWNAYRKPLESEWRPYIAGERTLPESAAALVRAARDSAR
jgi:hypothetical protein